MARMSWAKSTQVERQMVSEIGAMALGCQEDTKATGVEAFIRILPRLSRMLEDWTLELYADAVWQSVDDFGYMGVWVIVVRDRMDRPSLLVNLRI